MMRAAAAKVIGVQVSAADLSVSTFTVCRTIYPHKTYDFRLKTGILEKYYGKYVSTTVRLKRRHRRAKPVRLAFVLPSESRIVTRTFGRTLVPIDVLQ